METLSRCNSFLLFFIQEQNLLRKGRKFRMSEVSDPPKNSDDD
ncbi:Uncharacterized protein dnm_002680 [Desulfonema magnum]|uniref:Uncharacterized protein n=1 Tax=Desulfonema magnum TaxID=45655 RepID=A0A975BEK6_9BACT|nr:Uncharacterized protein dnm_002680 [Desulfonema magnum]